jgi:hypothetical protein
MYVIYALIDPRDDSVRYVGMTEDVYRRFLAHLRGLDNNREKNTWLYELRLANKMVIMKTLEEVEDRETALGREAHWIQHFGISKKPVVNIQRSSMWSKLAENAITPASRSEATSLVSNEIRDFIRRMYTRGKSHQDAMAITGLDENLYRLVCAEEGIPFADQQKEEM